MRLIFFAVYRENSFYGMHRPWMSEGSSVLWPGHENEIYRPPEVPLSVDADGITIDVDDETKVVSQLGAGKAARRVRKKRTVK